MTKPSIGLKKNLSYGYQEALDKIPDALAAEGFGILTEIDVKATLKKKIDVDFRPYKILGACNPPFAHKALSAELEIGLMMPCNVIVYEGDDGNAVVVAVDPLKTMATVDIPGVEPLAQEVRDKLARALESL